MRAMWATFRFDIRGAGRRAPRSRRAGAARAPTLIAARAGTAARAGIAARAFVTALLIAGWASFASAEGFAVPSFPARAGVDAVVAERFVEELRSALAERGVRVTRAPLVTAGIAGSLEPGFGELVAQIEGTRYAVLGEILARETGEGPYAVDMIAVDAVAGRTSDLVSRAFGLATLEAAAVEVAILLVDFTVPTQALPAGDAALFVSTDPNGAEVRIDGVPIGTSGSLDLLGLAPGRYEVEVRLEGYLPEIRTLDLRGAETHFLHVVLTEITGGSLQVVSRPGAEVWLDGQPAGTTPATLTTRPGDHEVEVRRPGFVTRTFTVPVRSFRVTRVEVDLEPLGEPLLVWPTDVVVRVLVDGELRRGGYALPRPGLQTIEVLQGGEVRRWWRVVPEAGVFELDLATGALVQLPR